MAALRPYIPPSPPTDGYKFNMTKLAFVRCLFDVLEQPGYSTMDTLWTNILSTMFPPSKGFILSHQGLRFKLRSTITEGSSLLIRSTRAEPETPPGAKKPTSTLEFYVTCEGYHPNTKNDWAMAEKELNDHLRIIYHDDEQELFCALAIGTFFRVYRFHVSAPALIRAQDEVADMATPQGRVQLEEMLAMIRTKAENRCAWAVDPEHPRREGNWI